LTDQPSRRTWRCWLGITVGVVIFLPLVLVGALLVVLNTAPGQREAEALTARLSGGTVRLTGLHGRVPDALRLDRFELRDAKGVWLTAGDVVLDWSPLHLLRGDAQVEALSAGQVAVLRLPVADAPASTTSSRPFRLPVTVDADRIAIADLSLAPAVAGAEAHLSATGQAHLQSLTRGTVTLALRRTDRPGSYTVEATMTEAAMSGRLAAQEPAKGLVSMAAHLPDLGAIGLNATLDGPWTGSALQLALTAGQLRATADGTLDIAGRSATLAVTASAPAMTLAPGTAWQSVAVAAKISGPLARPAADGHLTIAGLEAGGARIGQIAAHITADMHQAGLTATAAGIQLAAPNQGLLAGGPLSLQARMQMDDPTRPISYAFQQQILTGQGSATLAPRLQARLAVRVPALQPIAKARGRDVDGTAGFTLVVARNANQATRIDLDAALSVTGGADALPATKGTTTLGATVTLDGADISLSRLQLDGTSLHVDATGARHAGQLTADWHLGATDLHQLTAALRGTADVTGHLAGTQQNFAASADLSGNIGTAALAPGPVKLSAHGQNLPDHPSGHVDGTALVAGAPLTVNVDATRDAAQTLHVVINRADWTSARIAGAVSLPAGASLPVGQLDLTMARLDDLRPLLGQPLSGSLTATARLPQTGPDVLTVVASNAGIAGRATVARAQLDARMTAPTSHPVIAATLAADGLKAGAVTGTARLSVDGPMTALALKLDTTLRNLGGRDAVVAAAATLDTTTKALKLAALTAAWHDERLALDSPATLTYAPGIAVDRLRLTATAPGAAPATIELAGKLRPALALTVAARNITPTLARPFAPMLDAEGTLRIDAQLAGSPAAPTGMVRIAATGLRLRNGPARALPAVDLTATAALAGTTAQIDTTLTAGPTTRLVVRGAMPLSATGPMALRADGAVSLALLDPILTPEGRRVRGQATLGATITGTPAAPTANGTLTLANGEVQDYAQGIHITDIAAAIEATGQTVRIARFTGRAGGGTIMASGQIGLAAPMPVDLHLMADNARPITSDLVTATLDADIAITGNVQDSVDARGRIHVRRADVQVPDKLPASVAVLDIRRPGEHPAPAPTGHGLRIPLDIKLDAPQQIFVRGRGLDAELGGSLHIAGTAAAPRTSGSIELRRGTFSLAGTTLTFTSGDISFNGATGIDPALDLIATSSSSDVTATLTVGGYASAPKITLSSVPDRPQDEVLAALLFHQSAASLNPFQLAQIAAALAQVSGIGGGLDPISRLRKGLGLDRLAVGSSGTQTATGGASNATTTVEAGRYVRPGIYVGAKQGTSGAQTQAEVQIDITRGLKLNSDVGTGTGGNNVGLTYQFQY
jgi:translocation and assembly module TamB